MSSTTTKSSFTGLEMFKFAILMEEEGYDSYIHGAKYTTGKTKEFLLFAAKQELIHKSRFTKLSTQLISKLETNPDYVFDKDVTKYLKDLIENRVFNKKKQINDDFKDLQSALTYSLKAEKITINIYTQIYERIYQKDVSSILSIIIQEEKAHASYFSRLLQTIEA